MTLPTPRRSRSAARCLAVAGLIAGASLTALSAGCCDDDDDGACIGLTLIGLGDPVIEGSDCDDEIRTNTLLPLGQVIDGNGGDDLIEPGLGADFVDGGSGADTVSYENSADAVEVDLFDKIGDGGEAEADEYESIENVIGSPENDELIGDDGPNRLEGRDGDDDISGGNNGDDLEGGEGNDILNGNDGDDLLDGGDGDDFLDGGAGNDRMIGGDGSDNLQCGDGDDTAVDVEPSDVAAVGGAGFDTLELNRSPVVLAQIATFTSNFEHVTMPGSGVVLTVDPADVNAISPGFGALLIDGDSADIVKASAAGTWTDTGVVNQGYRIFNFPSTGTPTARIGLRGPKNGGL